MVHWLQNQNLFHLKYREMKKLYNKIPSVEQGQIMLGK